MEDLVDGTLPSKVELETKCFGSAIKALKAGYLVTREGWNGKGMFIFMRPADKIPNSVIQNIKSLPESVKKYLQICQDLNPFNEDQSTEFTGYLCMKAAGGTIVNGWLASQTDMLAEDWTIFSVE